MRPLNYQICTKTVMDTSDPEIGFDEEGVCHHWHEFQDRVDKELYNGEEGCRRAQAMASDIKRETKGKRYDCLIGLSGGVDSSYVAWVVVKELGLRPLAVHMDNGWNSELAVSNIERIVKKLDIDLHTEVLDWEEFRELQKAFFRASVGNVEMATDHAINATLFAQARKQGIRHILSGSNLNSEGIVQHGGWAHDNKDWPNLWDINRVYGTRKLVTYPRLTPLSFAWSILVRGVRYLPVLNYFDYDKRSAMDLLARELGWREYGRKHGESLFTRFFQEYYLPEKFGVDKRRSHFSSLICAGQMTREAALVELEKSMFESGEKEHLIKFACKKLEFTKEEWAKIMSTAPAPHTAFATSRVLSSRQHWLYRWGRKIATGREQM